MAPVRGADEDHGGVGVFAWLEPLVAFGGLLSWPLTAAVAMKGPKPLAISAAAWQAFCVTASRLPEDSPTLQRLRRVYAAAAERAFSRVHLFDPLPTPAPERPEICLILPHGHYCIAGKFNGTQLKASGHYPRAAFFVDGTLCALSPAMALAARMSGASGVFPVGDKHVRQSMQNGESIFMFPGGFVEASQSTLSGLRYYGGTYPYWCRRALEYGYDIRVLINYHGAELYHQSDFAKDLRLAIARRGFPAILPAAPNPTRIVVRQFRLQRRLPDGADVVAEAASYAEEICAEVERLYAADAPEVARLTGVVPRAMTMSRL